MKLTRHFLAKDLIEQLTTSRLLAYKNKLHRYPDEDHLEDDFPTKQSPEWQEAYKHCKTVLATREHIEK